MSSEYIQPSYQQYQPLYQQQSLQPPYQQYPLQYQPLYQPQYLPQNKSKTNFIFIFVIILICLIIWLVVLRTNGKFSEWSDWSTCNKVCGGGTQIRTRTYIPATFGGKDDPDKNNITQTQPCNTDICKIDGKMSEWIDNGKCQKTQNDITEISCGSGIKQQQRKYIPASNGGIDLDTIDPNRTIVSRWVPCNKDACTNADGSFTDWNYTGDCVKSSTDLTVVTCGTGTQKQTRIYNKPIGNGKDLPDKNILSKWGTCKNSLPVCPKPVDATCSDWIYDPNGCTCNDFGIYQTTMSKKYTAPINGGIDVKCDTSPITVKCILNDKVNVPNPPKGSTIDAMCPADPIFINFVDTDDLTCSPSKGKNRTKLTIGSYTFPVGKNHSDWFQTGFSNNIDKIKKISKGNSQMFNNPITNENITFTRINDQIPEQYTITKQIKCPDSLYFSKSDIDNIWKNTIGCSSTLNNDIFNVINSSYDELENLTTTNDIITKFSNFGRKSLLLSPNYVNSQLCNPNGYITFSANDKYIPSDTLIPGMIVSNTDGDVTILSNNNYNLIFQNDGNLVLYKNNILYWSSGTTSKNIKILTMQNDGNLTMASIIRQVWFTDTYDNPGAMLNLTKWGDINIINTDNNIIKTIFSNIKYYLSTKFWNDSPNALFSDKKGRVWKYTWSDYGNGRDIDTIPSNDGAKNRFRGLYKSSTDKQWDVTQRNLINPASYDTELNKEMPLKEDDSDINYNSSDDITNFNNDQKNIRKPPQFTIGGISKPNYIPGYDRISTVKGTSTSDTDKFLIMDRSGGWNQAFVLYKQKRDVNAFADSIIANHPELIIKIKNFL